MVLCPDPFFRADASISQQLGVPIAGASQLHSSLETIFNWRKLFTQGHAFPDVACNQWLAKLLCLNSGPLWRAILAPQHPCRMIKPLFLCVQVSSSLCPVLSSLQVYHLRPLPNKPACISTFQSLFPGTQSKIITYVIKYAPKLKLK